MKKTLAALGIAVWLVACEKKEAAPATATAAPAPRTQPPAANAAQPQGAKLDGTVIETMNAAGYTYMKLQTAQGETWVATPQAEVRQGQRVSIVPQMTAEKFESASLGRTFDTIVFGTMAAETSPSAMGTPSDPMQAKAAVEDVRVEKAEGPHAKTVAEIWSGKAALRDKPVVVRGTVVKYLGGIMGKNWLHLRDGSGFAANGDHDITVTTNDTAKVGDVVVVSGTVRVDKDFGAGYQYAVIIEDASVK
jgi:hypothetical protein